MDSIRIENLRSLADTGFVHLKPITLLVGQNNSGKSTFLRAIPLLRQSVEARTRGPILWYGDLVDFGDFDAAVNARTERREIAFHFRFQLSQRQVSRYGRMFPYRGTMWRDVLLEDLDITLTLRLSRHPKAEPSFASECSLELAGQSVRMTLDRNAALTKLLINSRDLSDDVSGFQSAESSRFVPHIVERESERRGMDRLTSRLVSEIRRNVHANTGGRRVRYLAGGLAIGTSAGMLKQMKRSPGATKTWRRHTSEWTTQTGSFQRLRDLVIAANLRALLLACDDYIQAFAKNSSYVPPLRAAGDRYYRLQDLAVDEVDFQGRNLAMFLRSLTDTERKGFSEWTRKHFGFSSRAAVAAGHVSLQIKETDCADEFNLTDKGFGFSQMLPILTQLWVLSYRRRRAPAYIRSPWGFVSEPKTPVPITFAIEQPELHLHPRLQGALADSFLDALAQGRDADLDLRLIIETHSQTIVNRLGHRVAEGQVDPKDISVVIFEKGSADAPTEVRTGQYDEKGFLTNWPFGFFEPDNPE